MSIGPRQHVEAVAIIRSLICAVGPPADEYARECVMAGEVWLRENHPTTDIYLAALEEANRD